jgi:hypothetical protein
MNDQERGTMSEPAPWALCAVAGRVIDDVRVKCSLELGHQTLGVHYDRQEGLGFLLSRGEMLPWPGSERDLESAAALAAGLSPHLREMAVRDVERAAARAALDPLRVYRHLKAMRSSRFTPGQEVRFRASPGGRTWTVTGPETSSGALVGLRRGSLVKHGVSADRLEPA